MYLLQTLHWGTVTHAAHAQWVISCLATSKPLENSLYTFFKFKFNGLLRVKNLYVDTITSIHYITHSIVHRVVYLTFKREGMKTCDRKSNLYSGINRTRSSESNGFISPVCLYLYIYTTYMQLQIILIFSSMLITEWDIQPLDDHNTLINTRTHTFWAQCASLRTSQYQQWHVFVLFNMRFQRCLSVIGCTGSFISVFLFFFSNILISVTTNPYDLYSYFIIHCRRQQNVHGHL